MGPRRLEGGEWRIENQSKLNLHQKLHMITFYFVWKLRKKKMKLILTVNEFGEANYGGLLLLFIIIKT